MTAPLRADTRPVLNTLAKASNPITKWKVKPAQTGTGQAFWRCVHVEKLSEEDNQGNHCVYVDAIDTDGQRIARPDVLVRWGWGEEHQTTFFEKPAWEPAANFVLSAGMNAWCAAWGGISDIVENLYGEYGHTSYYVVFQLQVAGSITQLEPLPVVQPPGTINVSMNVILDIERKLAELQTAIHNLR